jgi:hypothetical protein
MRRHKSEYPKIGPFYFYRGKIVAPDEYQRLIDPITHIIKSLLPVEESAIVKEHRDMWDNYMIPRFPELKTKYDDNHKALPRGRIDVETTDGLSFFVTLDKCIQGMEDEIVEIYRLLGQIVEFSYGTMNYRCFGCDSRFRGNDAFRAFRGLNVE